MNKITSPEARVSSTMPPNRSSNCPRKLVPATSIPTSIWTIRFFFQRSRRKVIGDLPGQTLHNRRFADASVAYQQRVVFFVPGERPRHCPNLGVATDGPADFAEPCLFVKSRPYLSNNGVGIADPMPWRWLARSGRRSRAPQADRRKDRPFRPPVRLILSSILRKRIK